MAISVKVKLASEVMIRGSGRRPSLVSYPFPFLLGCTGGPGTGPEPFGRVASAAHLPGRGGPHSG